MVKLSFKCAALIGTTLLAACTSRPDGKNATTTTHIAPPSLQSLMVVSRPAHVLTMMETRGEQDFARPVLRILTPVNGQQVDGTSVVVRLSLSGDLRGYTVSQDPVTGMGNHFHLILDNEPYEAYYNLARPFEFKNVAPGQHTLRAFASRPWHESYKNDGAFQIVSFTVRGKTPEPQNNASNIDPNRPLLTYSRPKGVYDGTEADPIMIDFWLSNAKLQGDGGAERIRYIIDDDAPRFADKWEPIWLSGWSSGNHSVRLELLGADEWPIPNGEFNVTTREIFVNRP